VGSICSIEERLSCNGPIQWPDYRERSIVNLAAWILQYFGSLPTCKPFPSEFLPTASKASSSSIVVLMADALGQLQLDHFLQSSAMPNLERFLADRRSFYLSATSAFPSTTPVGYLAFNTARSPAELGVFADNQWESSVEGIVRTLNWTLRSNDSEVFESVSPRRSKTIYQELHNQGIDTAVVMSDAFEHTPLSDLAHAGAIIHGVPTLSQLAAETASCVRDTSYGSFTFTYWHSLDTISHDFGPFSSQAQEEIRRLDSAIGRLTDLLAASGTLLVITADHGQINANPDQDVLLDDYPKIIEKLARPATGDRRAVWLTSRHGARKDLGMALEKELSSKALILTAEEVNGSGIFGPPASDMKEKLGDYLAVPYGDGRAWYDPGQPDGGFSYQKGVHGGLSRGEMLVPVVGGYL
jgi:hypothetical protein